MNKNQVCARWLAPVSIALGLFACESSPDPESMEEAAEQVKERAQKAVGQLEKSLTKMTEEVDRAFADAKDTLQQLEERASEGVSAWQKSVDHRVDALAKRWRDLERAAEGAQGDAKRAFDEARREIAAKLDTAGEKLERAGEDVSSDTRKGVDAALEDVERAIERARKQLEAPHREKADGPE